jgi:hypothetical protein
MKTIKLVTIRELQIKTLITGTIMRKEHTLTRTEMFTMDITMIKEIGLIMVGRLTIKVSTKDIGMRIINGLTQVAKIKIMITNKPTLN